MIMRDRKFLPLLGLIVSLCLAGFALGAGLLRSSLSPKNVASAETAAPMLVSALADKTIKVSGGLTISGHVSAPDGSPLTGVMVEAEAATPGAQVAPEAFVTDDNGNYSVALLSPGFFRVHFAGGQAGGGVWASEWFKGQKPLGEAQAVPSGVTGVNAVLQPAGALNAHLGFPDNNNPFPVRVVAFQASEPKSAGESGTGPVGLDPSTVAFSNLPAGAYKLMVIPDAPAGGGGSAAYAPFWYGGADWKSAAAVHVGAGKTSEIKIYFAEAKELGGVFGEISYDRGAYGWASVSLVSAVDPSKEFAVAGLSQPVYANAYDSFAIPNVPAGNYRLRCSLPDGRVVWYQEGSTGGTAESDQSSVISIAPGKMVQKLFFDALSLPAGVSGQIVRADGTPVAYQPVFAESLAGTEVKIAYPFGAWTDTEGRFSGSLSPGRYRFCTVDWGTMREYCNEAEDLGPSNPKTSASITMSKDTPSRATIVGKAKTHDGVAAKLAEVVLEPADGGGPQTCVADMQGVFRFDVPAGNYRIRTANGSAIVDVSVRDGEFLTNFEIPSD